MPDKDAHHQNEPKQAMTHVAPGHAAKPTHPPAKAPQQMPATQPQRVFVSIVLWIITIATILAWFCVLGRIENQLRKEHSVAWNQPANSRLNPGPPAFFYDRATNMISYAGIMDAQTKQQLLALFIPESATNSAEMTQSYSDAISRLAYEANDGSGLTTSLILFLGGLSATLGVMFRLMLSFVNMICYRRSLDLELWWPYYVLRPPVGFLIGFTVVLMVKAELLFKGEVVTAAGSLWWAGIAFVAGFAASEFTEYLITMSRKVFQPGDITSTQKTDNGVQPQSQLDSSATEKAGKGGANQSQKNEPGKTQ